MASPQLVITQSRDFRTTDGPRNRGQRYWTHVEVPGDVWYVVECGVETVGSGREVVRFITPDFWQARELYRTTASEWASLSACVRAPVAFFSGSMYATVAEVTHFEDTDQLLISFQSGLMCVTGHGDLKTSRPIGVGRRVFP